MDVSLLTDFNVDTSLFIPEAQISSWQLTFDLIQQQSSPIHIYVYGSSSLCSSSYPTLIVSKVLRLSDPTCTENTTFELCQFNDYVIDVHVKNFCKYTCDCQTECLHFSINVIPKRDDVIHQISDVSWQPVSDVL